jgi:hypothetical protein
MVFTRKFDRARMQVAVLDPNLIPQFVHVVIGDYLYELKFKVEVAGDGEQPMPMDMDHLGANDDDEFHEQNKDDNLGDKGNSCRRFETRGSLDRRVNCRRVPQPRWVGARRSAKGGGSRRETGVRGGIPRPSCLSRAQVGCACSRGLQAPTREGASGLTRAPSRPSPRGQPSVRGPWSFLL